VKVHLRFGKPPWIESRLQDFFGVKEPPRIARHEGAGEFVGPNSRPVAGDSRTSRGLGEVVSAACGGRLSSGIRSISGLKEGRPKAGCSQEWPAPQEG